MSIFAYYSVSNLSIFPYYDTNVIISYMHAYITAYHIQCTSYFIFHFYVILDIFFVFSALCGFMFLTCGLFFTVVGPASGQISKYILQKLFVWKVNLENFGGVFRRIIQAGHNNTSNNFLKPFEVFKHYIVSWSFFSNSSI